MRKTQTGAMIMNEALIRLNLKEDQPGGFAGEWLGSGTRQELISPVDGGGLASVGNCTAAECDTILGRCREAFFSWRTVPAPKRAEVIKSLGVELQRRQGDLARLITLEMGKSLAESRGEVQEMIDICDYAIGLSRQISGPGLQSERRMHRMFEQWHPLGMVGVITAFNFPMAVWAWNAALALVCGDTILWKPSYKTPLCALAVIRIVSEVLQRHGHDPAVCSLVTGKGSEIGDRITGDSRVTLVSYTGSVRGGRHVGRMVQERFGRLILELGGNNAVIVSEKGDPTIAQRAVSFGALGTSGQRCTTTRRVIVQRSVYDSFKNTLLKSYQATRIGNPLDENHFMGPLVDRAAVDTMMRALERIPKEGGKILYGGKRLDLPGGCYVTPCLVEATPDMPVIQEETFAPILYLLQYETLKEAMAIHNGVPQGLSSSIISDSLMETESFLSELGSDCGIANVNTSTNGAEIGGAFGGEKETGGGRESGSDAWKAYMRRQTCTVNYSGELELAQGLELTHL